MGISRQPNESWKSREFTFPPPKAPPKVEHKPALKPVERPSAAVKRGQDKHD